MRLGHIVNGCGTGKGTPVIENLIGLDFSVFALSLYRGKIKVLGDMVQLPFKSNSFSNILFIHSLDHLSAEERSQALEEAGRVLNEDGRVIIRVFSRLDFRYGKGQETEEATFLRGNRIQTHYFQMSKIERSPRAFPPREVPPKPCKPSAQTCLPNEVL